MQNESNAGWSPDPYVLTIGVYVWLARLRQAGVQQCLLHAAHTEQHFARVERVNIISDDVIWVLGNRYNLPRRVRVTLLYW